MSDVVRLDAWIGRKGQGRDEISRGSYQLPSPWIKGALEIGYVTMPRKLSIIIGDVNKTYVWIRIVKNSEKIRIGYPVIIFDYRYGEYITGIIRAMGYDVEDPELYDRQIIPHQPLTSELIQFNDTLFLELSPLYGVEPYCTLKKVGEEIQKESVNFAPHIRAPAFIPPTKVIYSILGVPDDGVPYGVIIVGSDLLVDPMTKTFVPYYMNIPVLFEHELVIGSTGKGKTVKCKNDIYLFLRATNGSVIVFDLHGEYSEITDDPLTDVTPPDIEFKIWKDMGVFPKSIKDVIIWRWARAPEEVDSDSNVKYFTIKFEEIPPRALQYYLPALSPQGYVVLPKLVRIFKQEYKGEKTFRNFYDWLNIMYFDSSIISNKTRDALLRRLAPLLEEEIFDVNGLNDIIPEEILIPGRVSIFDLSHIANNTIRRIIVLHVLRKISKIKLRDSKGRYPPTFILIDEAHNYFPKHIYDNDEKNYIERAINLVDRICKEGRKFKLRIEFSTQSPEDLHPSVIKTVNTITFFGVNPVQASILNKSMELPVSITEIMNLPTRRAIVYSRSNADIPIKILVPWPLLKHKISKYVTPQ